MFRVRRHARSRLGWLTRMAATTISPLMNICTKAETSSRLRTFEMTVSAMTPPTERGDAAAAARKRCAAENDGDDGSRARGRCRRADSPCRDGRPATGRRARRRSRRERSTARRTASTLTPARRALSALPPAATQMIAEASARKEDLHDGQHDQQQDGRRAGSRRCRHWRATAAAARSARRCDR